MKEILKYKVDKTIDKYFLNTLMKEFVRFVKENLIFFSFYSSNSNNYGSFFYFFDPNWSKIKKNKSFVFKYCLFEKAKSCPACAKHYIWQNIYMEWILFGALDRCIEFFILGRKKLNNKTFYLVNFIITF